MENREYYCHAHSEVGNFRPEFWQIPILTNFGHSATIMLHYYE